MLIKEWHHEKSCYFKDRANQGLVNQGLTVLENTMSRAQYFILSLGESIFQYHTDDEICPIPYMLS